MRLPATELFALGVAAGPGQPASVPEVRVAIARGCDGLFGAFARRVEVIGVSGFDRVGHESDHVPERDRRSGLRAPVERAVLRRQMRARGAWVVRRGDIGGTGVLVRRGWSGVRSRGREQNRENQRGNDSDLEPPARRTRPPHSRSRLPGRGRCSE